VSLYTGTQVKRIEGNTNSMKGHTSWIWIFFFQGHDGLIFNTKFWRLKSHFFFEFTRHGREGQKSSWTDTNIYAFPVTISLSIVHNKLPSVLQVRFYPLWTWVYPEDVPLPHTLSLSSVVESSTSDLKMGIGLCHVFSKPCCGQNERYGDYINRGVGVMRI
jgi:hypothetical protein